METLILDEALTALDAGRRQHAVGVLHALALEFPTLILITHEQGLADAFPVQILVEKGTSGSQITVVAA